MVSSGFLSSSLSTERPALRIRQTREEKGQLLSSASVERLSHLEGQYVVTSIPLIRHSLHKVMQSQMIGLQTSLDRILAAVYNPALPMSCILGLPSIRRRCSGYVTKVSGTRTGLDLQCDPALMQRPPPQRTFPPLLGFVLPYGAYGIVFSTATLFEDEYVETLPRSSFNALIEAL